MANSRFPEFVFELHVCRLAERDWPPTGQDCDRPVLVARQLGTRHRRWDTVIIECNPERVQERAALGAKELDDDLRYLLRHAPSSWAWYRDVLPDPGYPWRYVRETIHEAASRGLVETRRDGNRLQLRCAYEYPAWVDRIVAIENKPDLNASAANALARQLQYDISLGVADEVWVATSQTGRAVEPALLESMPVEAGILTVDTETLANDVLWQPRRLTPEQTGVRILDVGADAAAARIEYAGPEEKTTIRERIAERAWERGWRAYVNSMRPDCRHFGLDATHPTHQPVCMAKDRPQTTHECSGNCRLFEPEPPHWRTRNWPITGGPGAAIRQLLNRQRERHRPTD